MFETGAAQRTMETLEALAAALAGACALSARDDPLRHLDAIEASVARAVGGRVRISIDPGVASLEGAELFPFSGGVLGVLAGRSLAEAERSMLDALASLLGGALLRKRAADVRSRALRRLAEIGESMLGERSPPPMRELLRLLVVKACALTGARYGALGILGPEPGTLTDFVTVGLSEEEIVRIGPKPIGKGLLGAVLTEGRTIRVDRIAEDPRSSGWPASHPPMTSFLGAPLRIGRETFGNFFLTDKEGEAFTEEDAQALEVFSAQASLAVGFARRAEERRLLLDAILNHEPLAVILFDLRGGIAWRNTAAERLGASLRMPSGEPFSPDDLPQARALRGEVVMGVDALGVREDAPPVPLFASAAPVSSEQGTPLGAVLTLQDASTTKELERLREELSAAVAHDLRNPLQTMLLQIDLLARRAEGENLVEVPMAALERMARSGELMKRLVGDLLDTARLEGKRLVLEKTEIDLGEFVVSLVRQIEPTLRGHKVQVTRRGAPSALVVHADRARLEQVLMNLLDNASKFTAEGAPIEVEVAPSEGAVTVAVRDHGPGIAREDLPRLFERFFQTARAKKTGLGLGLYIARGFAEAHGGTLTAESELGKGSIFRLTLPQG